MSGLRILFQPALGPGPLPKLQVRQLLHQKCNQSLKSTTSVELAGLFSCCCFQRAISAFSHRRIPRCSRDLPQRNCSNSSGPNTKLWDDHIYGKPLKPSQKRKELMKVQQMWKNEEEEEEWRKERADESRMNYALPVTKGYFESVNDKSKEAFMTALDVFKLRDKNARGHVEFIYAALKNMRQFGVHRDLETYKKLIDVFPKGRFVAQNMFQVEFQHYPKQQDCAVDILDQMEDMGVQPDTETQELLTAIFGSYAFPIRKLMRMMYWMPKFKNLSPWPVPDPLPDDSLELAKLAIQRITSVDLKSTITCFNAMDLEGSTDHTWIVSGQSPDQIRLIKEHPTDRPIYVEGAFRIWLQRSCINYFILRAEPKPPSDVKPLDSDDTANMITLFHPDFIEKQVAHVPTVHEQEDGVILAVCATGTSSRDSIISWLQFLEEANPRLGKDISVLINLKSPLGPTDDLEPVEIGKEKQDAKPEVGEDPKKFVASAEEEDDDEEYLGLDPFTPELNQIGVGRLSDTKFVNWPHHYNEYSIRVKQQKALKSEERRRRLAEEREKKRLLAEEEKQRRQKDRLT